MKKIRFLSSSTLSKRTLPLTSQKCLKSKFATGSSGAGAEIYIYGMSGGGATVRTNFLRKHVIFNRKISKIPRLLVDPIVRYMLYFEFLVQKYFPPKNFLFAFCPVFCFFQL